MMSLRIEKRSTFVMLKRARSAWSGRLNRFRRDEDGSMILFGLFLLILMLMASGLAIDTMRAEYTRTTIQNTLDRAVLAAADLNQTEDARSVVIDYFDKAGMAQYLNADSIVVTHSTAAGQLSFRRVSATASTEVDTLFMSMLGVDRIVSGGASTAEEGITDLEISLVVDVSGSMGWSSSSGSTKIYELREAAKDFSYYMQCNPNAERNSNEPCTVEDGKVSISLVPYAEQVTVGSTLLDKLNVSNEHQSSDCVTFSGSEFHVTALDPQVELSRTGHFDPWNSSNYYPSSWTCRTDSWREVKPFMEDHNDVFTAINQLSAGGNTSIDLGMKWGAALLDPTLRPAIQTLTTENSGNGTPVVDAAFAGRPYDYTQEYSMKVVVLMTDGVNTDQHYLKDGYRSGLSEVYRNTDPNYSNHFSIYKAATGKYYYTHDGTWNDFPFGDADGEVVTVTNTSCTWTWWRGYRCTTTTEEQVINQPGAAVQMNYQAVWERFPTDWYAQWSWLEDPVAANGTSTKNARLQDICSAAKQQGVIVYTIGFEVSGDADNVMSQCASTPGHYFPANGSNLAEIFGVIASSINQLRLTQ